MEAIDVHTTCIPETEHGLLIQHPKGKISQLPNWLPVKSCVRLQCPSSPSRCQSDPHNCGVHSQTKLPPGKKTPRREALTVSKSTSARDVINDSRVCNVETHPLISCRRMDRSITGDKQCSSRGGGLGEEGWRERECGIVAREKEREL